MPEPTEPECARKIFIGGLSSETSDDSLRSYFGKYGEIVDCVVMKDSHTKRSRGFGFVTFSVGEMVDAVQQSRPHTIDGKQVETKRVVPKQEASRPESHMSVKKVFVGGFKEPVEESDLKEFFSQFGPVEKIETFTDKETGKRKGFAFVSFQDYDAVDKCVLMSSMAPDKKITIKNVRMEVKKALTPQEIKSGVVGGPQGQYGSGRSPRGPPPSRGGYSTPRSNGPGRGGPRGYDDSPSGYGGGYGDYGEGPRESSGSYSSGGYQAQRNSYSGPSSGSGWGGGSGSGSSTQGNWGGQSYGGSGGYSQGSGSSSFSQGGGGSSGYGQSSSYGQSAGNGGYGQSSGGGYSQGGSGYGGGSGDTGYGYDQEPPVASRNSWNSSSNWNSPAAGGSSLGQSYGSDYGSGPIRGGGNYSSPRQQAAPYGAYGRK